MKLTVSKSKISGAVSIPGSKSHTIRAIALASLAKGASIIKAPLISDDTISALSAASTLGAWIKRGDDSIWKISGTGGHLLQPAATVNMGNSGTGLRIFTAIAALADFPTSFDGDDSLRSRKMEPLLSAMERLGIKSISENGCCPLMVTGPMKGGETSVSGKSSQYLTALLFAAPLCPNDTIINVEDLHEVPYVEITIDWLKRQGIDFQYTPDYKRFFIKGNQSYKPFTAKIPGDFSTAAFPLVAGLLTGGEVRIKNLDFADTQGDKAIFGYMEKMGAKIQITEDYVTAHAPKKLHAVELDLNATPDALPVMAVAAAYADGISVFKNVAQARMKETDRIYCMARELEKMGIMVEEFEDGMAVTGGKLKAAHLESYKDHRIAMSLAIAGLAVESGEATVIDDAESIAVTYPSFIEDFREMGASFYTN